MRHVRRLVDDLLDLSRITRGKLNLHLDRVSIASVVGRSIELASPALEERRHHLATHVPESLDVVGDPIRLAQVFSNLLTNAAKFTEPGGRIEVTAEREGPTVTVRVRDSGTGLTESARQRMFEPFQQEENGHGGLGLGLPLARKLVELHGGSISADSEGVGCGSTFAVTLPVATEDVVLLAATPATSRPGSGAPQRILVVDDNVDAAQMLVEALSAHGHIAVIAADGPSALREAARITPDIAILDLGLPVMDGYELRQRLGVAYPSVRCIAVTGYGQENDRERTRAAGFQHHFVKPVAVDDLLSVLAGNISA